ncbi:MAG: hypothetical protein Q7S47_01765 [bacterium]|nr:hypothetical protein [bacterium]
MSTGNNNTIHAAHGRFARLAALNEVIFHTKDLATLWHIQNKNTLYTTLKRYAARGFIHRIYPGLYAIKPFDELDPVLLGIKAIHRYTYLSTETILIRSGIIFQHIPATTYVSSIARRFSIGPHDYVCRQLSDHYLYNDCGIEFKAGILTATPERAVADMLHFNPRAYFDAPTRINWGAVAEIQRLIGYTINTYDSSITK